MSAVRWPCAAAALLLALGALAQDACQNIEKKFGAEPLTMLQYLYFAECLGGDKDGNEVTKAVLPLVKKETSRDPAKAGHRLDEALRQISGYINSAARGRKDTSQPLLAALATEVEAVRTRLAAAQPLGDQDVIGWQWRRTDFTGLPSVSVLPLNIQCEQASEEKCTEAAETGKIVFRAAHLVEQTLQFSLTDVYEQALGAARARNAKWDRYFDEGRVQFPWELYANGRRYGAHNKKEGGFAEPPNDQIILLHPGVGMEYVGGAPSGSRFQAALILELIGYNRWSWTNDGKMQKAFGASLIQTYSDRAGMTSARPGVMVHFGNKYSVAVTSRDGKTGVLFSVDLAKLVTKVEDDERQKFKLLGRSVP
jgi:hypothetical protein